MSEVDSVEEMIKELLDITALQQSVINQQQRMIESAETAKMPGSKSYQAFLPVYGYAENFYLHKLLEHGMDYFPGKAAREVYSYCHAHPEKFPKRSHIPSRKSIKVRLKKLREKIDDMVDGQQSPKGLMSY